MELLKRTDRFTTYRKNRYAQKWLDEREDIVVFLRKFVRWIEDMYTTIAMRVNHNLGLAGSATWDPDRTPTAGIAPVGPSTRVIWRR